MVPGGACFPAGTGRGGEPGGSGCDTIASDRSGPGAARSGAAGSGELRAGRGGAAAAPRPLLSAR